MSYQYGYATCFDHNFCHHQALNEHTSGNQVIASNVFDYPRRVHLRPGDDQNCGQNM
jgi:hypothetical protein